jgi:hypothetical protein
MKIKASIVLTVENDDGTQHRQFANGILVEMPEIAELAAEFQGAELGHQPVGVRLKEIMRRAGKFVAEIATARQP